VDSVLLRRAIYNLLDNARKYSEPGSTIRVSASARERGVTIAVADSGIGIDDADLKQVFTPFFRSDRSRARQTGGFGLGLALARRVVEAHGGMIEIMSSIGRGTTVVIKLPTKPANE
jgi:signal transduction histidine kinase